ncbi:hypothetical protein BV511_03035 [Methylorubrum extorquens]|nr:hypothetical protein BV511_03035 [Methylorubrum extorquens]
MAQAYATACRRHRGRADAAERLREATTHLLKAEIAETKPRRGRPPAAGIVQPELFEDSRP